jgi:multidrug efflux system membrane fusion protein
MSRTCVWSLLLVVAACLPGSACGKSKSEAPGPTSGQKPGPAGPPGVPGPGASPGRGARPFPVETRAAQTRAVTYGLSAVGSVEAFEEVEVNARVAGVATTVRFVEGETVKAGQVLVEIDPARYQLALRSARAQLQKVKASLADARAGLERREAASRERPGLVPGEELETFRTRVASAEAELAAAQVAVESAELNLRDAYVRAPIASELQSRNVKTGQYLQPGTLIATLVRREPLRLRFAIPEPDAPRLSVGQVVTVTSGNRSLRAPIRFIAAGADPGSRMVQVSAELSGAEAGAFRPGAYARVTLDVGGNADAVLVPEGAVRPSEDGFLVFVVEGDRARRRVVELGLRTPDGWVEVRSGVVAGEPVVVRGAEALRDGATVMVQTAPTPAAKAPPASSPPASPKATP